MAPSPLLASAKTRRTGDRFEHLGRSLRDRQANPARPGDELRASRDDLRPPTNAASGGCSTDRVAGKQPGRQQKLLEAEGVDFSPAGTLDMNHYPFELAVDDLNELLVDTKAVP